MHPGVLIVGGGPTGYGAAAMLAQLGCKDIVLLERNESAEWWDSTKAYAYSLGTRAKAFLQSIGIDDIEQMGVTGKMHITYIEEQKLVDKAVDIGVGNTWVSRHALIRKMYSHVCEHFGDSVKVHFGSKVTHVTLPTPDNDSQICVETTAQGTAQHWQPKLLVAADGMNSIVQQSLKDSEPEGNFGIVQKPSDAAGLAFKILSLPPNPKLVPGSDRAFSNPEAVVIPGKDIGAGPPLRLGMLPNKDMTEPRSANLVQWPDHKLWTLKTAEELYDFLQRSFPQIDVRSLVTEEEAQRFVDAKVGRFPKPQYCASFVKSYEDAAAPSVEGDDALASTPGCAVVMVGDAMHAFPPDLGQGVNAALQDVMVLRECLQGSKDNLHRGLQKFQDQRLPDVEALTTLMQIGAPYQYRQARKALPKALWTLNFVSRFVLNKILPFLVSKPVFTELESTPSYKDLLDSHKATSRNLVLIGAVVVALIAFFVSK